MQGHEVSRIPIVETENSLRYPLALEEIATIADGREFLDLPYDQRAWKVAEDIYKHALQLSDLVIEEQGCLDQNVLKVAILEHAPRLIACLGVLCRIAGLPFEQPARKYLHYRQDGTQIQDVERRPIP